MPRPSSGRNSIDGVAKDGIQLKVKAKVTVRTNLDRLVGGATDETIIARVGEGIVNAIGSADTHKQVLEKPDTISKRVLEKGLDAGTAYEILSIDIADVDVGDNIGANLQALQAEADTRVARAKAEEHRAFAVAKEQEMIAQVQENRAKVVEAEAEIPRAIAEAFRHGNMGIHDYYSLRNVQADTEMRNAIAGTGNAGAIITRRRDSDLPGSSTEPRSSPRLEEPAPSDGFRVIPSGTLMTPAVVAGGVWVEMTFAYSSDGHANLEAMSPLWSSSGGLA